MKPDNFLVVLPSGKEINVPEYAFNNCVNLSVNHITTVGDTKTLFIHYFI